MSNRTPPPPGRPGVGRGLFVGRIFGIEFYLDYSWFLIATIVTYLLTTDTFPGMVQHRTFPVYLTMGVVAAAFFFLSILLHELGHSLVSQRCGIPVPRITLLFMGGLAEISREPDDAKSELKIALGGPAVSVALGVVFLVLAGLLSLARIETASAVCTWLGWMNLLLVVFNMIPGYPLDGGRILRALIWQSTGKLRHATFITSRIGIGFSWILIAGGVLILMWSPRSNWLGFFYILIGFFLKGAAEAGYNNALQREVLGGVSVRDIMSPAPVCIPDSLPLNLAVDDIFLTHHHVGFPVCTAEGEFRGFLRIEHLKGVPREKWPYLSVGDLVAEKGTQEMSIEASSSASRAMRRLLLPDCGRLAVTEGGKTVGIITRHDLLHFIKIHIELEA